MIARQLRLIVVMRRSRAVALSIRGRGEGLNGIGEDREAGLTLSCEHPSMPLRIQRPGLHRTYRGDLPASRVKLDASDGPALAAAADLVLVCKCGLGILVDLDQLRVGT